jgi:hypothetical protein
MKKELIIERLEKTIQMMKNLDEGSFDYSAWVSKYDHENMCGTICCVLGWYPKYFPETGITWDNKDGCLAGKFSTSAKEYHGISRELYDCLFTGDDLNASYNIISGTPVTTKTLINVTHINRGSSKLPDVILVWEAIVNLIKEGKLDSELLLYEN